MVTPAESAERKAAVTPAGMARFSPHYETPWPRLPCVGGEQQADASLKSEAIRGPKHSIHPDWLGQVVVNGAIRWRVVRR